MKRRLPLILFSALVVSCSSGPKEPDKPTAGKVDLSEVDRTRAFSGPDGIRVHVVELKGGERALIKVTGTRANFEGLVLAHEIREDGPYLRYMTQIRGRDKATIVREDRGRGGGPGWVLWVDYRDSLAISYDEKASATVDAAALLREHASQKSDGTLAKLQDFNRKDEEAEEQDELTKEMAYVEKECGLAVPVSVAWDNIDDEMLKKYSVAGYCDSPMYAMRNLCKFGPAEEFFRSQVKKVQCRFGKEVGLEVAGGTLTWTVDTEGSNLDARAMELTRALKYKGNTLAYHINVAETKVCADPKKKKYIVLAPDGAEEPGLLYGDGKTYYRAQTPKMLGEGWFFEPRHYNKRYNSAMRGYDLRVYSRVDVDKESGSCTLVCGTKSTKLDLLKGARSAKIATGIKVQPSPLTRVPYVLARDPRGNYYYVDRSSIPGRERDFKLYVGKVGNVKLQKMKDIVSDSEGEIFSSKTGELRLIVDQGRERTMWIRGKRSSNLTRLRVEDNYQMIYNQLGPYIGKDLGNPCDDYGSE